MFSFVLYQLKDSTIKEYYYITAKKKKSSPDLTGIL